MRKRKLSGALLGLAAFLILSGGLLSVTGLALGGRASFYTSSANCVETAPLDYTETVAFQKIEVDVSLGDVYLTSGSDYGVSLTWDNDNHKLYSEVVDGKLRVWDEDGVMGDMMGYGATATIYFPYDAQFEAVSIRNALGDMQLEDFSAKTLSVTSDLGQVSLSDIMAGTAELNLSLGDLDGYDVTVGGTATVTNNMGDVYLTGSYQNLDVTCDMGRVVVSTALPKSDYTYEVKTSMGSVMLDGEKASGGSAKGGSGDAHIKVENSMGDVEIMFG